MALVPAGVAGPENAGKTWDQGSIWQEERVLETDLLSPTPASWRCPLHTKASASVSFIYFEGHLGLSSFFLYPIRKSSGAGRTWGSERGSDRRLTWAE